MSDLINQINELDSLARSYETAVLYYIDNEEQFQIEYDAEYDWQLSIKDKLDDLRPKFDLTEAFLSQYMQDHLNIMIMEYNNILVHKFNYEQALYEASCYSVVPNELESLIIQYKSELNAAVEFFDILYVSNIKTILNTYDQMMIDVDTLDTYYSTI